GVLRPPSSSPTAVEWSIHSDQRLCLVVPFKELSESQDIDIAAGDVRWIRRHWRRCLLPTEWLPIDWRDAEVSDAAVAVMCSCCRSMDAECCCRWKQMGFTKSTVVVLCRCRRDQGCFFCCLKMPEDAAAGSPIWAATTTAICCDDPIFCRSMSLQRWNHRSRRTLLLPSFVLQIGQMEMVAIATVKI
ncbi:hypothetical protein ACLOJK_028598, partial [Asimina triloba]